MLTKIKTVASSIVTKLGIVAAVLGVAVATLTPYVSVPVVGVVLPYLTGGLTFVTVLSQAIKRLTEVPDDIVGWEPVSTADKAASFTNAAFGEAADTVFWRDAA
jgi:hypothetical protein